MDGTKYLLACLLDHEGRIKITANLVRDIFPEIPRPSAKEMEARLALALIGREVEPIPEDSGLSSLERLENRCKANKILCTRSYSNPNEYMLSSMNRL